MHSRGPLGGSPNAHHKKMRHACTCANSQGPQCQIAIDQERGTSPALCHTSLSCSNAELEATQPLEKGSERERVKKLTTAHSPGSGLSWEQGEALNWMRK